MEFSGRLTAFPIGDILQWAQNDRRSGALVVRRSGSEKRVYFQNGDIVACHSDEPAEFFGQYLLVEGLLDEARLIQALSYCQKGGGLLGRALVEVGLLTPGQMREALRAHVEDLVCDLFLWKSGIFYFTGEMAAEDQRLPEPLSSSAVALEGSRRADEIQRIRRLFVHDDVVLERGKARLAVATPLAKRIVRMVDGERSLRELHAEVRGSRYRFLETCYRLTVDGVLDIGDVKDPTESHSSELRLADLLMEQLAQEQTVLLNQHLAVPLEALERFVPVWVRPPNAVEEGRATDAARAFYDQIDGRRDLATLFGGVDREERARRMDRLVLQLRNGALALLPAPLESLEEIADAGARPAGARWWRKLRATVSG